ncbi:MAG TPA: hypothetical protein VMC03_19445 [Streptosporangiaceae bacterium]|nr:hypothetical protein [Streptosporangiaceae bacterium]
MTGRRAGRPSPSRRQLLAGAGAAGAGVAAGGLAGYFGGAGTARSGGGDRGGDPGGGGPGTQTVAFHGAHQAGIATPVAAPCAHAE